MRSGSQRGVPGALKFLLWSPEPYHFTDWSPDPFWAGEPGAQRHFARSPEPGARSPEPSIFKFDHSSSQIALIDYCLFVFGIKKQNLKRGHYMIQVYALSQFIMICNNLFRDLMKTLL